MSEFPAYLAEFIGTTLLVLLGNGVVANVELSRTKGHGAGWIVITAGWGCAVFVGVLCSAAISGAHLNPAVSIGIAAAGTGDFGWGLVPGYILAQMLGAMLGALLVYVFYRDHFTVTEDAGLKQACFCTAPAIRSIPRNFLCEAVGTFVLVYAVLLTTTPTFELFDSTGSSSNVQVGLGSLGAIPVGIIVFAIGLSLGGTTGYAINPARDLAPRIMHAILPIPGKGSSDWSYAPVPVFGPIVGALLAAAARLAFYPNPA